MKNVDKIIFVAKCFLNDCKDGECPFTWDELLIYYAQLNENELIDLYNNYRSQLIEHLVTSYAYEARDYEQSEDELRAELEVLRAYELEQLVEL